MRQRGLVGHEHIYPASRATWDLRDRDGPRRELFRGRMEEVVI